MKVADAFLNLDTGNITREDTGAHNVEHCVVEVKENGDLRYICSQEQWQKSLDQSICALVGGYCGGQCSEHHCYNGGAEGLR